MKTKHNTYLSPDQEIEFKKWAGKRIADTEDYDLRGYYSRMANRKPIGDAHLPDTYKKPNHPTFSDESQYHGAGGSFGGHWTPSPVEGKDSFHASQTNKYPDLEGYFQKHEPNAYLIKKKGKK